MGKEQSAHQLKRSVPEAQEEINTQKDFPKYERRGLVLFETDTGY